MSTQSSQNEVWIRCTTCNDIVSTSRKEVQSNDALYCLDCLIETNCQICEQELYLPKDEFAGIEEPICSECYEYSPESSLNKPSRPFYIRIYQWCLKAGMTLLGIFFTLILLRTTFSAMRFILSGELSLFESGFIVIMTAILLSMLYKAADWALRYNPDSRNY